MEECYKIIDNVTIRLRDRAQALAKMKKSRDHNGYVWIVTETDDFACEEHGCHTVSVKYVHNPRDADMIHYEIDGKDEGCEYW